MTITETINNSNWQLNAKGAGVVIGVNDVEQAIAVILTTRKGTDPLRPHFGCGLHDYIDRPINQAIPLMKKEILESLRLYEPRITINRITSEVITTDE